MKSRSSSPPSEGNGGNMRSSPLLTAALSLLLLLCAASANGMGPDHNGATPRFICTPIPADADPSCFGEAAMGGQGRQGGRHGGPPPEAAAAGGGPSSPSSGWWGMPDEAKATILHLRESLLKEKESVFEQRETIRELNAKLALCEGFGRSMTADDDHSGGRHHHHHRLQGPPPSRLGGVGPRGSGGHRGGGNRPGIHRGSSSNLLPDAPRHSAGAGTSAGHVGDNRKDNRHTAAVATTTTAEGEMTSSPDEMDRMLQALKERLESLQKRNASSAYSSSLKELLQRKISTMEQQLHPPPPPPPHPPHDEDTTTSSALSGPRHHDDHHDDDDGHREDAEHGDPHKDYDDLDDSAHDGDGSHGDDDDDDDDDDEDGHHGNEEEDNGYGYVAHTGYRPHSSNTLETILNQLHRSGPDRTIKAEESPAGSSFQIGFPMRTNYMYSRVKRSLPNEIFALTLCLWIKGGPGLGTPFSYSAPGQANELVLIEWGNNPMELLVDDKAVTLPLSLGDGKWHHVCVTWSTREGQWEAYQDGVQRGSGDSLSAWHPIKPGGVFIIGQEQDTLGGRFDATQSFVGEISDLQMWSHVLAPSDIHSLASCGSHLTGDVLAWSETELEHHGGVSVYPFDPCHEH